MAAWARSGAEFFRSLGGQRTVAVRDWRLSGPECEVAVAQHLLRATSGRHRHNAHPDDNGSQTR